MFTLGAKALVPEQRHQIVLRSDTGCLKYQVQLSAQVQGRAWVLRLNSGVRTGKKMRSNWCLARIVLRHRACEPSGNTSLVKF